ncbi:cytochrome c3 family protein [Luteolibacter arcticus]|uniref:Cytochrome c3 family protein n=1 Tax=Luteolibacter arcticus TaxID=1581411 RepID=A0ABT3GNW3_9BACT|nr:cytochrome c3 family protein [Luteolibacter arcticus]MCW1925187.1 cytochrome c3 family protein [Luteolibacter arcticus]
MSDPHPTPEFPEKDYIRPNHDWACGRTCQGGSCSVGPSPRGKCRATYECAPRLETKPGESKGHWMCTRAKSAGGTCDKGPFPDGTCCNAVPKCQPRLTLRGIRKRVTLVTILASLIALYIGIGGSRRDDFINPGPISSVHASDHFTKRHAAMSGDQSSCAACHASAGKDGGQWHVQAVEAFKQGLAPHDWTRKGPLEASPMDQSCLACHQGMDFHQANMPSQFACHACHKEHVTDGAMPEVDSGLCISCHGDATLMAKAREQAKGAHSTPAEDSGSVAPPRQRPATGYTEVINSFHTDHPEFRQLRDLEPGQVRDTNPLKFNHAYHLKDGGLPFPPPSTEQLDCRHCHERDARGEYQRPITYSQHCATCHPLKFDPGTSDETHLGLLLPHGDPYYVRAFVRSLPIQYAEYARTQEGITQAEALKKYVDSKVANLEGSYQQSGEFLERAVFFADHESKLPDGRQTPFNGCATCHEVTDPKDTNGTPGIAKPATPERWMTLGSFNHDLHSKGFKCADCHNVTVSEKTSDLNLPSIKRCVDCHSPKGGIDHRCTSCHTYHHAKGSLFGDPVKAAPAK